MCHGSQEWVDILPTVLLGLRVCFKEDLKASPAELVYGTTLRIPGEFFLDEDLPSDPQMFIEPFREHMRELRSSPTAHHRKIVPFVHKDLHTCSHVFLREDAVKKPLQQPYSGPHLVVARPSDIVFTIRVNGKDTNISIERLKPAFTLTEQVELSDTPKDIRSGCIKTYAGPGTKKNVHFAT
jgi:hypothetical protein